MQTTQIYQIKVRERLDARWSDWFDGLAITCEVGSDGVPVTTLTGFADQAALRGILWKLWDLNLKVISVAPVEVEANPSSTEGGV